MDHGDKYGNELTEIIVGLLHSAEGCKYIQLRNMSKFNT